MKIRVLLSGAGAAAAAAVFAAYRFMQEKQAASSTDPGILGAGGATDTDPTMMYLSVFFVILGAMLVVASLLVWRKEEDYI
jgi:hypothetical protein